MGSHLHADGVGKNGYPNLPSLPCLRTENSTYTSMHTVNRTRFKHQRACTGAHTHLYSQKKSFLHPLYSGGKGLKYQVCISCWPSWITSMFFTWGGGRGAARGKEALRSGLETAQREKVVQRRDWRAHACGYPTAGKDLVR